MEPEVGGHMESSKSVEGHSPGVAVTKHTELRVDDDVPLPQPPRAFTRRQLRIISFGLVLLLLFHLGPSILEYWAARLGFIPGEVARCRRRHPVKFEGELGQIKWGPCGDPELDIFPVGVSYEISPNSKA